MHYAWQDSSLGSEADSMKSCEYLTLAQTTDLTAVKRRLIRSRLNVPDVLRPICVCRDIRSLLGSRASDAISGGFCRCF